MPIRERLSNKTNRDTTFVRRAIAAAIKAQKANIEQLEAFDKSDDALRVEYAYLTWLEAHRRHDGKLSLVKLSDAG